MIRARLLIVDDKENFLSLFRRIVGDRMDVTCASDGAKALALLACETFDVIVSDLRMPGADGLTVLREAKRADPDVEVILVTAYGTVPDAVQAMKLGAFDYLTKPFDPDEAWLLIEKAAERRLLRRQARDPSTLLQASKKVTGLVGASAAIERVSQLVRRAAECDVAVLVSGESGTGKELVARLLHGASARGSQRFSVVDCPTVTDALTTEVEPSADVGAKALSTKHDILERAAGSTLFLDEIGELSSAAQANLVRRLRGGVDVRVVAATSVALDLAVREGRFREDLYYTVNMFPIELPPLRDRREDIAPLATYFIERLRGDRRSAPEGFTTEALLALVRFPWPGNVRQLESCIARAAAVCDGERIDVQALPEELRQDTAVNDGDVGRLVGLPLREVVAISRDRITREYLTELLTKVRGNVTQAAEIAGMERETIHRLLKRHGVRPEDFRTKG